MPLDKANNVWKNLLLHHSSVHKWKKYKFIGSSPLHVVDGGGSDSNEDKPHEVEVEGAPMMFNDEIWISGEEHHHIEFLCTIG